MTGRIVDACIRSISFADNRNGWAIGQTDIGGPQTRIYTTTDGGVSWTALNSGTDERLYDVHMLDLDNAVAVGEGMIRTANGGATWEPLHPPPARRYHAVQYLISQKIIAVGWDFSSGNMGFAVGDFGVIMSTIDGGVTWQTEESHLTRSLLSVAISDAQSALASGHGGTIVSKEW